MKTRIPIPAICLLAMLSSCRQETANAPLQETESLGVSAIENPDGKSPKDTGTIHPQATSPTTAVYICESSGARKYHLDAHCRGLKRCKHTVKKVSAEYAEGKGLELCGFED